MSDYNLDATLASGQAFRWRRTQRGWEGIVGQRWISLILTPKGIRAEAVEPMDDWEWLSNYLQSEVHLPPILATFPNDQALREAVNWASGLRLLRQDPWECLASFILSSSKQIVQIEQIVAILSERWGQEVAVPPGVGRAYAFPSPIVLANCSASDLRNCKMGFRAPYLKGTAELIAGGSVNLESLAAAPVEQARATLLELPGVGPKIADCVLLFAYGFSSVFPIDVWVARSLRDHYFAGREVNLKRLTEFASKHFGPHAGYAQQYLFHRKRLARPS